MNSRPFSIGDCIDYEHASGNVRNGGKRPSAELRRRPDEPDHKIDQPNNAEAKDHEGRSPLRPTAIGRSQIAIAGQVQQPRDADYRYDVPDKDQAEREPV
jgi:hypothetical protein